MAELGACPRCGGTLLVRLSKQNGGSFIGCSGFPLCRYSAPLPEESVPGKEDPKVVAELFRAIAQLRHENSQLRIEVREWVLRVRELILRVEALEGGGELNPDADEEAAEIEEYYRDKNPEYPVPDNVRWREIMAQWMGTGVWHKEWGASPGHPACSVPPHIIDEYLSRR